MIRRVEPYLPEHISGFVPHPTLVRDVGDGCAAAAGALARAGSAFTLRAANGRVLCLAGLARFDDSWAHGWAFMAADAGPHMPWLTRTVRDFLDRQMPRHRRIEAFARADFPAARRWAGWLGFTEEGVAHCMASDGTDMIRFARVNRSAAETAS